MKKTILGAIVGGIIIFVWQTLSYTALQLHKSTEKYTPNQDSVLAYLSNNLHGSGSYSLPMYPQAATFDEQSKLMEANQGKPMAQIIFHKAYYSNMVKNMIHAFLIDVVLAWFFCWIVTKFNAPSFGTIFISAVFTGFIVFLNTSLTAHVWYLTYGMKADLIDAIVSWGLVGVWLGSYMRKR